MIPEVWGDLPALSGLCIWGIILLLPWRPWSTRETLDADADTIPGIDLSRITVLVPARNEADVIEQTLQGLASQGQGLKIILIDDQSTDQTSAIAFKTGTPDLNIVPGQTLPEGWSGKLWALEQGRKEIKTDLVLLLDADIRLLPGTLRALMQKLDRDQLDLVSLMAHLDMQGFWGKLLIPAFVFFFKLLYPFNLSNSPTSRVAAAAGGCILVKKSVLDRISAFTSLRNALIDDCALARRIKDNGGRTWIGLTHSAVSLRPYHDLKGIWDMVARSAFTQLRYSCVLLMLCTLLMAVAFLLPLLTVLALEPVGIATLVLMVLSYLPTLKYYGIQPLWGCLLPVTGVLYLGMTWSSACRHLYRKGTTWKGRRYNMNAGDHCNFQ
jgi:hopene-associated glycosyltransferase HpnB